MNIQKINEELDKLLNESVLSETKTKQQAIHKIYKNVKTDGFFKDEGWSKVHEIVNQIRELGGEVVYYPTNDSHYTSGYPNDGSMKSKEYTLEITFINTLSKEIKIGGTITCSGAGTVEDPLSIYDVSMVLW